MCILQDKMRSHQNRIVLTKILTYHMPILDNPNLKCCEKSEEISLSSPRRIKVKGRLHQILRSLCIVHSIDVTGSFLRGVYQVDTQLCTK